LQDSALNIQKLVLSNWEQDRIGSQMTGARRKEFKNPLALPGKIDLDS
jgi:hypothetical protein